MPEFTTAGSPFAAREQQETGTAHNARALDLIDNAIRTEPEDLDKIAMVRAAIWIVAVDGIGHGVTKQEADALADTIQAAAAARRIISRLSGLIDPPHADAFVAASHWVIKQHMPKTD